MNKKELINVLAMESGFTKKVSEQFVNALTSVVQETVAKGEDVVITGFGKWTTVNRAERQGVNPATMAKITIPAKKSPVFRAGKGLKDAVDQA